MSFSEELRHTLHTMGFIQLLLVLVFLGSYVLALSGLTGPIGRRRAGALALAAAIGFSIATPAWATGAMMMVLAVAGVGLFVAAVLTLDRLAARRAGHETYALYAAHAMDGDVTAPEAEQRSRSPLLARRTPGFNGV